VGATPGSAEAEFDDFYRSTASRTLRYAYGLTGDPVAAQDLAQEAYVRAWQRWRTVRGYDNAEAWLRRVATSLATDRWRRIAVRRRYARANPPAPVPPPDENTVLLAAALRRLPVRQRRALTLRYLLDLPVDQIATELGITQSTVRSTLARGRAALAALLTEPRTEERNHA
jgi:RNA polymerase sigma-70 factor, ECF subfamily